MGAVHGRGAVCLECSAVLDELALDGVRRIVVRLESGTVGGVEGLDADRAGRVRATRAAHPSQSHSIAVSGTVEHTTTP